MESQVGAVSTTDRGYETHVRCTNEEDMQLNGSALTESSQITFAFLVSWFPGFSAEMRRTGSLSIVIADSGSVSGRQGRQRQWAGESDYDPLDPC